MYTAGVNGGHTMNVRDLEFQGQPSRSQNYFNIFDIFDLENVRIDTKINFVSCYNRRYERSCKKVFDLDFQGHAMKIEFFIITVGFLDPENISMRNIFEKFGREDQNPGGWYPPPLGVRRWIFTLGICGLTSNLDNCRVTYAHYSMISVL